MSSCYHRGHCSCRLYKAQCYRYMIYISNVISILCLFLGSSVHSPEGQSEAPNAEHCPAQLAPWPQVATSKVLSGWQQVTLLVWLENVKALSKKSTEGAVVVFPGYHCLVFLASHDALEVMSVSE